MRPFIVLSYLLIKQSVLFRSRITAIFLLLHKLSGRHHHSLFDLGIPIQWTDCPPFAPLIRVYTKESRNHNSKISALPVMLM